MCKKQFIASKIKGAMKERGINNISFARLMDVQPSIITKWLSGTHNFTIETIFQIEGKLCIEILMLGEMPKGIIYKYIW